MIWAPWRRRIKIDGISHVLYNFMKNAVDGGGFALPEAEAKKETYL